MIDGCHKSFFLIIDIYYFMENNIYFIFGNLFKMVFN